MPSPQRVLIVGASRGIGAEFGRQYLEAGARVTATARSSEAVAALQAQGAVGLKLDVLDANSGATLAQALAGQRFDTVVFNAGVYGPAVQAPGTPFTETDFDAVMHTNVLGPMRVLPALAAVLASGGKAVVAVLSSRMGSIGSRSNGNAWLYRASKAAVNSVLKDLSFHFNGQAIFVALHPGWVQTDMGGADADLTVQHSVADLRATLARLMPADNGSFLNHDGAVIAW